MPNTENLKLQKKSTTQKKLIDWQKEWVKANIPTTAKIHGMFALFKENSQEIGIEVHFSDKGELKMKQGFMN